MKGTIEIHGMEFFAHHGCQSREREKGNDFLVDIVCTLDFGASCESDRLEDTVDCAKLYIIAQEQMQTPSNLLENVAWRIRNAILESDPRIEDCQVGVSKKNPPLPGRAAYSKITLK